MKKCKVNKCEGNIHGKEYCDKHYMQLYRNGKILERTIFDINEIINCGEYYKICLYKGKKEQKEIARAKIDKDDLEKVKKYKWYLNDNGYTATRINDKNIKLHLLILGNPPKGYEIDHKNTNKLDNRKLNLRFVTHQQNCMNNKAKGYSWNKIRNKWQAYIGINNELINLGYFDDKQDAVKARKKAELKYFKEFAYNN